MSAARRQLASPIVPSGNILLDPPGGVAGPVATLTDPGRAAAAGQEIVAAMLAVPTGHSSTSVYETGRLVSSAPWLTGHVERIGYLLDRQRADGGWGGPQGYALVPTLSAAEALLSVLGRPAGLDEVAPVGADRVTGALRRALRVLVDWLDGDHPLTPPDLPATDLIVPALLGQLHRHLDHPTPAQASARPTCWPQGRRLALPAGIGTDRLDQVRRLVDSGRPVPEKLLHALEVGGAAVRRAAGVSPAGSGAVGASPAATAAWIGAPGPDDAVAPALAYLEAAVGRHGGPVPCATPITVFERAWVLSTLVRAGVPLTVPSELPAGLHAALGPTGTATGPGLPADADTTSVTLYALARMGRPVDPGSLRHYDTGEHFCTWQGEDGASVTTNAHVLDALGWQLANRPAGGSWLAPTVERLTGWLRAQQSTDGRWSDRWHASPYYATSCAVLALHSYGRPAGVDAVDRAVRWVVATQRPDGSWGRWSGTAEETAYALTVLAVRQWEHPAARAAALRGERWLAGAGARSSAPPLWHDKDLYRPELIVRAAVLAARRFTRVRGLLATSGAEVRAIPHMISIA